MKKNNIVYQTPFAKAVIFSKVPHFIHRRPETLTATAY